MRTAVASAILLSFTTLGSAHRLDEYLQATTFSLEKRRVHAQIRLTPGVAVFPIIMATVDTNGDGAISAREQRAYAERVLADLSLAVDGDRLKLWPTSTRFPKIDSMKEGLGAIEIDFAADLRRGTSERKLVFENHHQRPIATYLVNCLVPQDSEIRVTGQHRNYEQSQYELTYVQDGVQSVSAGSEWWSDGRAWSGAIALLLFARGAMLWRRRQGWTSRSCPIKEETYGAT